MRSRSDPGSTSGRSLRPGERARVVVARPRGRPRHPAAHGWVGPSTLAAGPSGRPTRRGLRGHLRAAAAMGWLEAIPPHRAAGPVTIQCHASWEHRLLGDASAADLGRLAHGSTDRPAALQALRDFLEIWHHDPDHVTPEEIAGRCPGVRTLTLRASGLLVTYGELNTLPDYLSDPTAMDSLPVTSCPSCRRCGRRGMPTPGGSRATRTRSPIRRRGRHAPGQRTLNDIWESMWLNDPHGEPAPGPAAGLLAEPHGRLLGLARAQRLPLRTAFLVPVGAVLRPGTRTRRRRPTEPAIQRVPAPPGYSTGTPTTSSRTCPPRAT